MSLSLNYNSNPTAVKYNNQDCREVWWRPNEYSSYQRVWVCAEPFTVTAKNNGILGFASYSYDVGMLPTSSDQSDGFEYHYYHRFEMNQGDLRIKAFVGFEDTSNAYIQATRTWNSANWAIEINPNMILTGKGGPNAQIKCKTVIYGYDSEGDGQYEENIIYMDPIKPTIEYITLYNFNLLYNNGWNGSFRADNLSDGHGPKVASIVFPDLVEIALKNGVYTGNQGFFKEFHLISNENVIRNMSFRFKATIDGIGYHSDWLTETVNNNEYDYTFTFTMYPELD